MRATSTSICRCSAPAAARWWRRGSRRCARRCARGRRAARRGSSATRRDSLAAAWPAERAAARARSTQRGAPDIVWVARLGAAAPDDRRAAEAALSARARRAAAGRRAAAAPMIGLRRASVRARRAGAVGGERARRRGDRRAARRLVPARLERAEIERPAARPRTSSRIARMPAARSPASSCRGWSRTRRKSFRSRSRARGAAAGSRARCSTCICGGSPDLASRAVFLEVDEHNAPALRLYQRAGFREVGRRPNYYREPAAQPPPRWCCAAILAERAHGHGRARYAMSGRADCETETVTTPDKIDENHRGALRRQGHAHDRAAPRDRARAGRLRRSSRRRGALPALRRGRRAHLDLDRLSHRASCSRTPASSSATISARAARATSRSRKRITTI